MPQSGGGRDSGGGVIYRGVCFSPLPFFKEDFTACLCDRAWGLCFPLLRQSGGGADSRCLPCRGTGFCKRCVAAAVGDFIRASGGLYLRCLHGMRGGAGGCFCGFGDIPLSKCGGGRGGGDGAAPSGEGHSRGYPADDGTGGQVPADLPHQFKTCGYSGGNRKDRKELFL